MIRAPDLEVAHSLVGISLHSHLAGCCIDHESPQDEATDESTDNSFEFAPSHRFTLHYTFPMRLLPGDAVEHECNDLTRSTFAGEGLPVVVKTAGKSARK
jgi:hypothetical protein